MLTADCANSQTKDSESVNMVKIFILLIMQTYRIITLQKSTSEKSQDHEHGPDCKHDNTETVPEDKKDNDTQDNGEVNEVTNIIEKVEIKTTKKDKKEDNTQTEKNGEVKKDNTTRDNGEVKEVTNIIGSVQ